MCDDAGMARHLRVEFPGAIYHVAIRMLGDWKKEGNLLFEDDGDRERFLSRLADRVGSPLEPIGVSP